MARLTVALLRRRAEHNEGCLSSLKEIALHQQDLERIETIGDACRELEIIYLSSNYIPRIEGLVHLKWLKYLNLAVNNIKVVEGLEGCEMLEKLDLTVNFVADLESVPALQANIFLETLHLTGNPCTDVEGYRGFVIKALPQLRDLDGEPVARSEQIVARQQAPDARAAAAASSVRVREEERLRAEMVAKGIDPFPPRFNEAGERVYGHSAEERVQMLREAEEEERRRAEKDRPAEGSMAALAAEMKPKAPVRLSAEEEIEKYGRILHRNEAKLPFTIDDTADDRVVVTVQPGRFISTTLIGVDAQPTHLRVTVKGKLLQLPLDVEVAPDRTAVQRSATTGELRITLPFARHVLDAKEERQRWRAVAAAEDDEPPAPRAAAEKQKVAQAPAEAPRAATHVTPADVAAKFLMTPAPAAPAAKAPAAKAPLPAAMAPAAPAGAAARGKPLVEEMVAMPKPELPPSTVEELD